MQMKHLQTTLNPVTIMLKDSLPAFQPPSHTDLKVAPNFEVDKILAFIDINISDFCSYYKSVKDSNKENRISDILVHHFQLCKIEQTGGFFPYDFRKNPTQPHTEKETDIGVFVMTRNQKPLPIIEFEAKRFSESSNNKEYVSGKRGGIERFKRGHHSSCLAVCGMFGYVQSRTSSEWILKVNNWIEEQSQNDTNTDDIDWKSRDEKLSTITNFQNVVKLKSEHTRRQLSNTILLWHYFIYLC